MIFPQYTFMPHIGRTIIVGDVHGCFSELLQLLDSVGFSDEDLCILCGDFMDRGPDSMACARFVQHTRNCVSVLGNHERKIVRIIHDGIEPAWSQSYLLDSISNNEKTELVSFFQTLPAVIETFEVVVTHGRLDPALSADSQDVKHAAAVGGESVVIEKDAEGVPLWYHEWRGKYGNKPVCIGHLRYGTAELVREGLYTLDTNAVCGNVLSALLLPEFKVVQVNVPVDYHAESFSIWLKNEFCYEHISDLPFGRYIKLNRYSNSTVDSIRNRFLFEMNNLSIEYLYYKVRSRIQQDYGELPLEKEKTQTLFRKLARLYTHEELSLIRIAVYHPFNFKNLAVRFKEWNLKKLHEVLVKITA